MVDTSDILRLQFFLDLSFDLLNNKDFVDIYFSKSVCVSVCCDGVGVGLAGWGLGWGVLSKLYLLPSFIFAVCSC